MRYIYRTAVNALAFYLGLYLLDTLLAPYFLLKRVWMPVVLAVLLAAINSTNRPFRGYKNNRGRAFGFFGLTVLGNYLLLQVFSWLGTPFYGHPIAIMFAAAFLTLLTALLNHLVGFKPKDQPKVVTRQHGFGDAARERQLRARAERHEGRRRKKQ